MAATRKTTRKKNSGTKKPGGETKSRSQNSAEKASDDIRQAEGAKTEASSDSKPVRKHQPVDVEEAEIITQASQQPHPDTQEKPDEGKTPPAEIRPTENHAETHTGPPQEVRRRSGFVPMVLGGAVAAAIGFGTAYYYLPQGVSRETTAVLSEQGAKLADVSGAVDRVQSDLAKQLDVLDQKISTLEPEMDKLKTSLLAMQSDLGGKIEKITGDLQKTSKRLDALETRVLTIEKRPVADTKGAAAAAVAAYESELQALRDQLEQQKQQFENLAGEVTQRIAAAKEQATEIQKNAEETAKTATAQAKLSQIEAALEAGGGFESALNGFSKAMGIAPPAPLQNAAKNGVATLGDLQASFPDAARTALSVSIRSSAGDNSMDKFTAFLKSQVSPRSLKPREGDDPDAVLSRAEAAVKAGDLGKSLAILESLPDAGKAAMADWMNKARERVEALKALAELKQALNSK